MEKINIIPDKKLADGFIEILRTEIEKFDWLEFSYPAAAVGIDKITKNTYPEIFKNSLTESIKLIPDNSAKSYCFFEKNTTIFGQTEMDNDEFNLNLIFWFDLLKINSAKTFNFSSEMEKQVKELLQNFYCYNITIDYENVFSKYNMDRSINQWIMYPYSAFKINFKVKYKNSC